MIPEEVLNLPELVMATTTAKFLRPLLNRWLGGFGAGAAASDGDGGLETADQDDEVDVHPEATVEEADNELHEGSFVLAEGLPGLSNGEQIVCRVIKESGNKVTLSYFDPKTEEITQRKNLAKSVIKTRLKSEDLPHAPTPRPDTVAGESKKKPMCSCF